MWKDSGITAYIFYIATNDVVSGFVCETKFLSKLKIFFSSHKTLTNERQVQAKKK